MTFGEVKNTNEEAVPIYMMFSVTQIKNPGTVFDTKYLVTAGAEYDKETYIWVGQSEVTVHNSTVGLIILAFLCILSIQT